MSLLGNALGIKDLLPSTTSVDLPSAQGTGLPQSTEDLINQRLARTQEQLKEPPKTTWQLAQPVQADNNPLLSAINQRQSVAMAPTIEAQRRAQEYGLKMQNFGQARQATQNDLQRTQLAMARAYATKQRRIAEDQMRANAISSILGFGGTIVGAIYGGAPGALAGGAVGTATGQQVGQMQGEG